MAGSAKANVKTHTQHGWEKQSTDHVNNVSLVQTHYLMQCTCNWRGWVVQSLIDETESPT